MKYIDQYRDYTKKGGECSYNTFIKYLKQGKTIDEILNMIITWGGNRVKNSLMDIFKEMKAKGYKFSYSTMRLNKHYIYKDNIHLINY